MRPVNPLSEAALSLPMRTVVAFSELQADPVALFPFTQDKEVDVAVPMYHSFTEFAMVPFAAFWYNTWVLLLNPADQSTLFALS